ncbi:AI-2E family transporter [Tepidibacter mesophilus]|uniref:AI-2E family transporter n=1 Tax=Tepidibacter mesophilus TaxID=655607 RepID=UPI0016514308|nr:AI-2E family transporter [Tepidibacter mesophilus]
MIKDNKKFIEKYIIVLIGLLILGFVYINTASISNGFSKLLSILKPFFIAFFIAYIFDSIIMFLKDKFKIKNGIAILIVYSAFVLIMIVMVIIVIPVVVKSIVQIINDMPNYVDNLLSFVNNIDINILNEIEKYVDKNSIGNLQKISKAMNYFLNNFLIFITNIGSAVVTISFSLIISVYMLIEKESLKSLGAKMVKKILKEDRCIEFIEFSKKANVIFSSFLTGLIVQSSILGTLCFIGFLILKIKYSLLLAVIIACTNVIPYIGPFIGATPAVIVTLFYAPMKALWVCALILILQQVDANIVGPKIMGNYIGLSPFWIIFTIAVGGGFFGIMGMIFSVPVAAIIKIIFSETFKLDK